MEYKFAGLQTTRINYDKIHCLLENKITGMEIYTDTTTGIGPIVI